MRAFKGKPFDITLPGVIAFAAGTTLPPFEIPNTYLYEALEMQLSGSLVLAGYTAAPTIRSEGIENLIRSVQLTGNAKGSGAQAATISNVDLSYLRFKSRIFSGTDVDRVDVSSANGTSSFYTTPTKHFGVLGMRGIQDNTYLDARLYSKLNLSLSTRDVNAIVKPGTGAGGGTATLNNVYMTVHARVWQGAGFANSAPYVKETMQQQNITSGLPVLDAVPETKNLPVGNAITAITFKGCIGDVDYAEPVDDFFSTTLRAEGAHVKVEVAGQGGVKTWTDQTYDHLVAANKVRYRQPAWPDGYARWDPSRDGNPSNILDMRGAISGQTKLDLTPTAGQTNTLFTYVEELMNG